MSCHRVNTKVVMVVVDRRREVTKAVMVERVF